MPEPQRRLQVVRDQRKPRAAVDAQHDGERVVEMQHRAVLEALVPGQGDLHLAALVGAGAEPLAGGVGAGNVDDLDAALVFEGMHRVVPVGAGVAQEGGDLERFLGEGAAVHAGPLRVVSWGVDSGGVRFLGGGVGSECVWRGMRLWAGAALAEGAGVRGQPLTLPGV